MTPRGRPPDRRGPGRRPVTITLSSTLYAEAEQAADERGLRLEEWAGQAIEIQLVERRRAAREDRPA